MQRSTKFRRARVLMGGLMVIAALGASAGPARAQTPDEEICVYEQNAAAAFEATVPPFIGCVRAYVYAEEGAAAGGSVRTAPGYGGGASTSVYQSETGEYEARVCLFVAFPGKTHQFCVPDA